MNGVDVFISSLGEELVARRMFGIAGRVGDMTDVMRGCLDDVRAATARQFDTEGRYGSGGWDPPAPSTVERKAAAGLPSAILVASGRGRKALTGETSDSLAVPLPDGFDYGTTLAYMRLHQTGTSRMPRRRPAQLPDQVRRGIVRRVQRGVLAEDRSMIATVARGLL